MSEYNPYNKIRKFEKSGIKGYEVDGMYFGTMEAAQMHVRESIRPSGSENRNRPWGPHDIVMRRVGELFEVDGILFENSMEAEFFASELAREFRSIEKTGDGWRVMGLNFESRREAERAVRMHARQWAMVTGHMRRNQMRDAFLQGQRDGERIIDQVVKDHQAMQAAQEAVEKKTAKKKPAKPQKRDRYEAIRV